MRTLPSFALGLVVFFLVCSLSRASGQTVPAAPVLTPAEILRFAKRSSDSYRAIDSQSEAVSSGLLRAEAPLDFRVNAEAGLLRDKREPTSPFSPNRIYDTYGSLGVSKAFQSGTSARVELRQGRSELGFASPGASALDYADARVSLGVSQSLLKDSFGAGTRRSLEAAELGQDARRAAVREAKESWSLGILNLYYGAWLAQRQLKEARESDARRSRLLSVAELRSRRGTTEAPDLLQIRASVLSSKNEVAKAEQALSDKWQSLVLTLKLDGALARIDPITIDLRLDDPVKDAKPFCKGQASDSSRESAAFTRIKAERQSSELLSESAKINSRPDLKLDLGLMTNGIDARSSKSFSEAARVKHPAWTVGLSLSMPIERSAEKAEMLEREAARIKSDADFSAITTDEKITLSTYCATLERLQANELNTSQSLSFQKERTRLQSSRFDVGRASVFDVIAAEDDVMRGALELSAVQMESRLNAWRILGQVGELNRYLERL